MNTLALLSLIQVVSSPLLNLLINVLMVVLVVAVIVWGVTKVAGPPDLPQPARWIIWIVAAIVVLVLICYAFGVRI